MDRETYLQYYSQELGLTEDQLKKVEQLKSSPWAGVIEESIDVLLETKYRLEQERIPL
jgi:hypothetical protein